MNDVTFNLTPESLRLLVSQISSMILDKIIEKDGDISFFESQAESAVSEVTDRYDFVDNFIMDRIDFDDIQRTIMDDLDYDDIRQRVMEDIDFDDLGETVAENISPDLLASASGLDNYMEEAVQETVDNSIAGKLDDYNIQLALMTEKITELELSNASMDSEIRALKANTNRSFFSRLFGG